MKKTNELLFEAWIELLNYLDRHKIQGRIMVFFAGLDSLIFTIKLCANDILTIIEAFKK